MKGGEEEDERNEREREKREEGRFIIAHYSISFFSYIYSFSLNPTLSYHDEIGAELQDVTGGSKVRLQALACPTP